MKAADVVHQLASGADAPGAAARPRDGPLQECEPVELDEGTEVMLVPSGHGVPLRFGGEMPAEMCPWLYSHAEGDGRVHVMSEPFATGKESFPLFYFAGSVPKEAVKRRKA